MLSRIIQAAIAAAVVWLACVFVGGLLALTAIPILVFVGGFIKEWAVVISILVFLAYFFGGGTWNPFNRPAV